MPDRGGRSGRRSVSGRGAFWIAVLAGLGTALTVAATIVDKWPSLRGLWVALTVIGALVAMPAVMLTTPWGQHRQEAKAAERAAAAERARAQQQAERGHFTPRGRGVLPFSG